MFQLIRLHIPDVYAAPADDPSYRWNDMDKRAGFGVQRIIPYGTPEEVRSEARLLMNAYARPGGRFMPAFGNGITPDARCAA